MCRFKNIVDRLNNRNQQVSIHPMCRFKVYFCYRCCSYFKVSIHPMCRFKDSLTSTTTTSTVFQYILCVGSRKDSVAFLVDLVKFQYILCVGSRHL